MSMGPQPIPDQRPLSCSLSIVQTEAAWPHHQYNIPRTMTPSSSTSLSTKPNRQKSSRTTAHCLQNQSGKLSGQNHL